MKVAILSDIHGNTIALNKVLEDIQSEGEVGAYWFAGDYVAIGYDPVGVLEIISKLPNTKFIRGNTDRYIYTGELPWAEMVDSEKESELAKLHLRVARSFSWTAGAVGATGWLPWFTELPVEMRTVLADGTKVLLVHAAPGTDDGMGININTPEEEISQLVSNEDADLVIVGHTHVPFEKEINGKRVLNPGSVSNPFPPDLRASYAILIADENGYSIAHKRVEYDRERVVRFMREVNHPSKEYVQSFMKGEARKDWME